MPVVLERLASFALPTTWRRCCSHGRGTVWKALCTEAVVAPPFDSRGRGILTQCSLESVAHSCGPGSLVRQGDSYRVQFGKRCVWRQLWRRRPCRRAPFDSRGRGILTRYSLESVAREGSLESVARESLKPYKLQLVQALRSTKGDEDKQTPSDTKQCGACEAMCS